MPRDSFGVLMSARGRLFLGWFPCLVYDEEHYGSNYAPDDYVAEEIHQVHSPRIVLRSDD